MVTFLVWPLLDVFDCLSPHSFFKVTVSACSIFGRPFCINPSLESLVLVTFCSVLFAVSLSFFLVTLCLVLLFFVYSAFGQPSFLSFWALFLVSPSFWSLSLLGRLFLVSGFEQPFFLGTIFEQRFFLFFLFFIYSGEYFWTAFLSGH